MKTAASFYSCMAAALLIVLASTGIAAAQAGNDTCAGVNASIGGTCTALTNTISGNRNSSAFGFGALQNNTTGIDKPPPG